MADDFCMQCNTFFRSNLLNTDDVSKLWVNAEFSDWLLCFIEEEESEEGGEQDIMQVLGSMVMAMLVKYWIYICGGMFFFVSFEGTIVMYKIIYMMMFLSCVALYQVLNTAVHCCIFTSEAHRLRYTQWWVKVCTSFCVF